LNVAPMRVRAMSRSKSSTVRSYRPIPPGLATRLASP
jgi:hypothetical protein